MAAAAVVARPAHGARLAEFFPGVPEPLPNVGEIESAFQLQEYVALLIRADVHNVSRIVAVPASAPDDKSIDEGCWVYEQLRRLAQDLTHPLITTLQQECTRQSCPEMKAGEWLYLCVAHGNGGTTECCAIDYILHTLDSATALLNSPRAFPSRISIPPASHRHFSSLARRLSRIFAHAYFHHREAFEQSEAETSLYARFLALSQKFDLVPPEFLVIPSPAAQPPALPSVPNVTTANTSSSGSSPNSESPNDALSPGSLARLGRPRTDTMYFSGDFNFMQAAAAAGSPLQTAAPEQPKPALHDLREPDQTNASLDIFHHPFENAPRAETVPLPSEEDSEADRDPFADPPAAESPIEREPAEVVTRDFGLVKEREQEEEEEEEGPEVPRGKSPLVVPHLDEAEPKPESEEAKEEEPETVQEETPAATDDAEEKEEEEEKIEPEPAAEAAATEEEAKEPEVAAATKEDAPLAKEPEADAAAS